MRFNLPNGTGISCRDDRFTSLERAFLSYHYTKSFRLKFQVNDLLTVLDNIKRIHA